MIGSRSPLPLPTWDLAAHGNFVALKAQDLRLELDEYKDLAKAAP